MLPIKPSVDEREIDQRTTLMGNAAHAMPPVGGAGANFAVQDATDLLRMLKKGLNVKSLGEDERLLD